MNNGAEIQKPDCNNIQAEKIERNAVRKNIISLAWPSVAELMLVTLCEMIDMMMVGKLGPYAITAVGLTSQPKFVMLSMFIALNVGVTALVARLKGEENQRDANKVVRQALVLTLVLSVFISILGVIFSKPMIVMMGADADTVQPGINYFTILMSGFVFTAISLCVSAALRGAGNTRASMWFNITANAINVLFNYLLIEGRMGFPALGVSGAAIATVIGWTAASVMAIATVLSGNSYIFISFKHNFKPDKEIIKRIIRIGLPAAGEQFALRAGLLLYVRTVSSLGTVVYATHQISISILSLSFMNGQAFGIAATSLIGQSLGQKKPELAKEYAAETRRMGSLVSTLIAACFFFFGAQLVSLYTDSAEIIKSGGVVLKIVALLQPFQSSFLILSGALRGAGDARWPALSTFIGVVIIRPILSFLCVVVLQWGLIGAWVALVCDQLFRFCLIYFRFLSGKWTSIKV